MKRITALVFFLILLGCSRCSNGWNPPPVPPPPPTPTPTPDPVPPPTPTPSPEWPSIKPILDKYSAGTTVTYAEVESILGKPREDYVQPSDPKDRVATWDLVSEGGAAVLHLHLHFNSAGLLIGVNPR